MKIIRTPDVVRLSHADVTDLIRKAVQASTARRVVVGAEGVQHADDGDHFAAQVTLTDEGIPHKETCAEAVVRILRRLNVTAKAEADQNTMAVVDVLVKELFEARHLTYEQKETICKTMTK